MLLRKGVNVVRKSDGTVSPFMPRGPLLFCGGYMFNNPDELLEGEPRRWFDENPQLQGYLPFYAQVPMDSDGNSLLNEGTQLNAPLLSRVPLLLPLLFFFCFFSDEGEDSFIIPHAQ